MKAATKQRYEHQFVQLVGAVFVELRGAGKDVYCSSVHRRDALFKEGFYLLHTVVVGARMYS